ncbi:nuclease-related domain-containing protein [Pseudalkalibacillus sp. A8]|uniref:nuclease-related domain-containing protein n=1 Tax=Pseudalkalibacillus sp. A8 TaxID=3382641 RepID=UPI0038B51B94
METIFFIAIILVLICVVIGLLFFVKKKHKDYDQMIEEYQMKATASIAEMENNLQQQKEEEVEKVKGGYETKIDEYKEYIQSIEKFSRNESEISTHIRLTEIKKKLVFQGTIKPLQMLILPNIFVPYKTEEGQIHSAKIDHLVVMNTGIYVIGTKYWQGNVLFGISKEKAKEFPFIHDNFFAPYEQETEKTIVYTHNDGNPNELKVRTITDSTRRVMTGARSIKELLEAHVGEARITPILYVNHGNNKLINYSQKEILPVFDKLDTLYDFFVEELENTEDLYSIAEIEEIKNFIENIHITT